MKQRPLAQTGIMVSPLGLGTVKFGRNQGVKYPQGLRYLMIKVCVTY